LREGIKIMKTFVINARFAGMTVTGVQRSAHEIVSRLVSDNSDRYALVSPRLGSEGPPSSFPIEEHGYIRQGHLWEQIELPRIVRSMGKNAVLYSPMTSGPLAVRRQVMTAHDLFPIEYPEWFSRAFGSWYRWLLPRLLKNVAYVLANSRYTRKRILERYEIAEDKVVLCPFAQHERFTPVSPERLARFRAEQGLPERYLFYLGPVNPRKNLVTLIAAWRRTRARRQGIKLIIAGDDALKKIHNTSNTALKEMLNDPTIQMLGYFSDEKLPLLYGSAEVFALPSLAEGFGLPVLEAMACGTPVICSNTTAMPEVAGGAARLVPALEVEAWTEAMDSLLSDSALRERMSEAGLRRAAQFSWDQTVDTVSKVLARV
jgi:glycosyltransferase involved in cell wall biosynthesis